MIDKPLPASKPETKAPIIICNKIKKLKNKKNNFYFFFKKINHVLFLKERIAKILKKLLLLLLKDVVTIYNDLLLRY